MPTVQEHLAAFVKAKAAGDTEAAEYIHNLIAAEYNKQDEAALNPAAGMGTGERFRAGIGQGMMNVARNVGNITQFVSDEEMRDAAARDAPLLDTTAGKVGSFIGETAAVTLPTMGVAGALGRGAGAVARVAKSAVGRGMVEGVTQGTITAGPENRISGGIIGGVAGAVLPAIGAGYKVARRGVSPTASARHMMKEGISLTPGQMNPKGALNQVEEAVQAIPFLGKVVTGAREKGLGQFQQRVVQEVAPPGVKVNAHSGDVSRMVAQVSKAFDDAYDFAKGYPVAPKIMRTQGGDVPLGKAFVDAVKHRGTLATDDQRKKVGKFLSNELSQLRFRAVKSDDLISVRSHIRAAARGESDKGARDLLKAAERAVTDAMDSQLPPDVTAALRLTDTQYGKFKILEDAVTRARDQSGSFTPAQFSQAVRQATSAAEYARGGGRMRNLSKAGFDVFSARQPMTGRQAITVAPLLAAAYAEPVTVGFPLALSAAGLYGTSTGRKLAAGQTGAQLALQHVNRNALRAIPKTARETSSRYARNALVNYAD